MPNPSGPEREAPPDPPATDPGGADQRAQDPDDQVTDVHPAVPASADADADADATTEVLSSEPGEPAAGRQDPPERRFTAPGFDAGQTEIIHTVPAAPTEVLGSAKARSIKARPQLIPPRLARKLPAPMSRSWGWVLALVLVVVTLAAIAVLGTVWLTRDSRIKASQEDQVRSTLEAYDLAVQNGDLATLRSITCGSVRDGYVNYTEEAWTETYRRIAAAKRYPVIASIDEVIVTDGHAEANVTAFMAYAPQIRSTRSFDLQYRDNQWKICQWQTG